MTDDLEQRLRATEEALRQTQAQLAALTRRVFELEGGGRAPILPPPVVHRLDEHRVADITPSVTAPGAGEPASTDWEATLGTNWLNRIGVILLVIGITSFLGYAMANLGPAGKVAIGAATGALMLAVGYFLENRGHYRPFSLAIIAGGFAVLYATAYAAHAVEAARIVDNIYIGVTIQTLIAIAAVWQAVVFDSEKAASLGFLAAYLGLTSGPSLPFLYGAVYPLTLGGLWLSHRCGWRQLPWGLATYTWFCELQAESRDWEFQYWGHPVAWFNLALFDAYEISWRMREAQWRNAAWIALNTVFFIVATFANSQFSGRAHAESIFMLATIAALASAAVRTYLGIRAEACIEAIAVTAASMWTVTHFASSNPWHALLVLLAIAMLALLRNRHQRTLALVVAAEGLLAVVALGANVSFPDSKLWWDAQLRIREGLPYMAVLIACLFAAGRWLVVTPWPSWAALVSVAVFTLFTIPKAAGTMVLALEAIAIVAAGLYLNRRQIRLGGIAMFLFSILKVFVYDLSELDTLPRIFSFIVLGAMLIGASWAYTRYREELQKYL